MMIIIITEQYYLTHFWGGPSRVLQSNSYGTVLRNGGCDGATAAPRKFPDRPYRGRLWVRESMIRVRRYFFVSVLYDMGGIFGVAFSCFMKIYDEEKKQKVFFLSSFIHSCIHLMDGWGSFIFSSTEYRTEYQCEHACLIIWHHSRISRSREDSGNAVTLCAFVSPFIKSSLLRGIRTGVVELVR